MVKPGPIPKRCVRSKRKRKGLRRVSEKRGVEEKIYSKLRILFLKRHPWCELCISPLALAENSNQPCMVRASTVHHCAGRGKHYLDVKTWKAGCWPCHDWVERNKNQARELGLITYK